jgi:peptide/nickel transport system substrate-binding protein
LNLSHNEKAVGKMVVVGIIILVILVAGIAAGYYFSTSHSAQAKDTLVIGTTDSVETSIDPANAYDFFGWELIESLGSPLVEYKAGTDQIVPALATDWTVTTDGLHWTFNLRHGVHFDNGSEFTADSVKYSFDRNIQIADPDGPFIGIGYGDIIDNVVVVSTYSVQFNLKNSLCSFPLFDGFTGILHC